MQRGRENVCVCVCSEKRKIKGPVQNKRTTYVRGNEEMRYSVWNVRERRRERCETKREGERERESACLVECVRGDAVRAYPQKRETRGDIGREETRALTAEGREI